MSRKRHPLYEDVNWNSACTATYWLCSSHPLYEDVNWNSYGYFFSCWEWVILYMRMWIEIGSLGDGYFWYRVILYMRMWIEIFPNVRFLLEDSVILYMRMWIEIPFPDRLWPARQCHPLYEDVNWNIQTEAFLRLWIWSSSIWGCELKFEKIPKSNELLIRHPLYEDVNWNPMLSYVGIMDKRLLSVTL